VGRRRPPARLATAASTAAAVAARARSRPRLRHAHAAGHEPGVHDAAEPGAAAGGELLGAQGLRRAQPAGADADPGLQPLGPAPRRSPTGSSATWTRPMCACSARWASVLLYSVLSLISKIEQVFNMTWRIDSQRPVRGALQPLPERAAGGTGAAVLGAWRHRRRCAATPSCSAWWTSSRWASWCTPASKWSPTC
jgi:hypothetical protein